MQWCGVGFSQLPNGLGFGGSQTGQGNFAVYVDCTLDKGMSRPIATYGSPSLSHEQVFEVAAVECWLLQPPEGHHGGGALGSLGSSSGRLASGGSSGSVLDAAAEDQSLLELAGVKLSHSEGVRQAGPDDELPTVWSSGGRAQQQHHHHHQEQQ